VTVWGGYALRWMSVLVGIAYATLPSLSHDQAAEDELPYFLCLTRAPKTSYDSLVSHQVSGSSC
jgi:hypothetical protein